MTGPKEYIEKKGWEFKVQRDQYVIRICPKCGDQRWKFGMSQDEGLYSCWICNCKGTLRGLMRDLGDLTDEPRHEPAKPILPPVSDSFILKYHEAFLESAECAEYLKSRGIAFETGKKFQLCHKKGFIGFPSFRVGKCVVIKWRSLPPAKKTFIREPSGAESLLFNEDALSLTGKEIILTEGEIDCLTLLDRGIRNTVSVPNGASSADPDWVKRLRKFRKVYIAFDPDAVGQKGGEALSRQIGEGKCLRVPMPAGEDINDFLRNRKIEDFNALLEKAIPYGKPHVVDYDWIFEDRMQSIQAGEPSGLTIQIPPVAEVCGKLFPGNVYILSSYPKVGKTILSMNIAWDFARIGLPVLFYCLEMTPREVMENLLAHEFQTETVDQHDWDTGIGTVGIKPFHVGWNPRPLGWKETLDVIRQECLDLGIRFLVIDNFHYLCRAEKDILGVEGTVSREIKFLAQELNLPIWLIVHPRKKDGQIVEEKMPSFHDLRGTSALGADASAVLILHRKLMGDKSDDEVVSPRADLGLIRNDTARFGVGGARKIWFDGRMRTFRAPSDFEKVKFQTQVHEQGTHARRMS